MKITIPILQAVEAFQAFQGIGGKASVDMSWAIDDIKEELEKHQKRFSEERLKLLEKYGEKNSIGSYTVKKDSLDAFTKEHTALGEIEVTIDFSPLDYDILVAQGVLLPVDSAKALRKFVVKQRMEKVKENKPAKRKIQPHKEPAPLAEPAPKPQE